jgi:hypothetical protein
VIGVTEYWYVAAGIGRRELKITSAVRKAVAKAPSKQLVVCIDNDGYAASLQKRKIYVALRDLAAERHGLLRVIDESGHDYLYPKTFFRTIASPPAVERAVPATARVRSAMRRAISGEPPKKGGILAALRRSPLGGADLDLSRSVTKGREVDL